MVGVHIRPARAAEAGALSALVLRSKGHWGYGEAFLAACRAELAIRAGEVAARRIVVAEDAHEVVGVASLEGAAPEGRLGLLFVEPWAIGRGVGRTLYAHVLATARELGFTRLVIDSDPHAEPFYRAMGARPAGWRGGLLRFEVVLAGRDGWLAAWTGGRRAVHVGNVTEFQGQFAEVPADVRRGGAHYACLAAFAGPHPAALVLPRPVPDFWIPGLARRLGWGEVEVFDGLGDPVRAVLDRPALAGHLRGLGLPLVPWGHTEAFAELAGERLPPGALRHESKRAANELFARIAPGHPGVVVPEQWQVATHRAAVALLRSRSRAGHTTVIKTEHGAGGWGTRLVAPGRRSWVAPLYRLPRGPLLLEEYLAGGGAPRDPTYDGLIDAAGEVHDVGIGAMDVRDCGYEGVTVGPGVVPGELAGPALRFGHAVGRELAASGYRGWFDVDFATTRDGRLAPVESNLRLTGPAAAFMIKARLDELRPGAAHLVRTLDRIPLAARLPERQLAAWLAELAERCAGIDALLLPTIPTAAFDPAPSVGVALAARTRDRIDAAAALISAAARDLARLFTA